MENTIFAEGDINREAVKLPTTRGFIIKDQLELAFNQWKFDGTPPDEEIVIRCRGEVEKMYDNNQIPSAEFAYFIAERFYFAFDENEYAAIFYAKAASMSSEYAEIIKKEWNSIDETEIYQKLEQYDEDEKKQRERDADNPEDIKFRICQGSPNPNSNSYNRTDNRMYADRIEHAYYGRSYPCRNCHAICCQKHTFNDYWEARCRHNDFVCDACYASTRGP